MNWTAVFTIFTAVSAAASLMWARSATRTARSIQRELTLDAAIRTNERANFPNAGRFLAPQTPEAVLAAHPCDCHDPGTGVDLLALDTQLASEGGPEVGPVITYSLPGQPTTGRTVSGSTQEADRTWKRHTDGTWELMTSTLGDNAEEMPASVAVDRGDIWTWAEMLEECTLTLVPLTDAEKESELLYGPVGARWGNPDEPCPYWAYLTEEALVQTHCALGLNHVGVHEDREGRPLGVVPEAVGAARITAAISPQASVETGLCTCGHPGQHQPGCPRYDRVSGIIDMGDDPDGDMAGYDGAFTPIAEPPF